MFSIKIKLIYIPFVEVTIELFCETEAIEIINCET
jgi:hypothetical protein